MRIRPPATRSSRGYASPSQGVLAAAVVAALAASAPGQRQFEELGRSDLPADTGSTSAIAVGDVDGDGDADIVLGQAWQCRLYLNDGSGSYEDVTASHLPQVPDTIAAIALGDVDGDGDLDLVFGTGNYRGSQNRLYLNNGAGTFTDGTATLLPADSDSTQAVTLGDVDGDGDLDLVTGNISYGYWGAYGLQNRLYVNDGTGSFADQTAVRMPTVSDVTRALTLGDLDGDGDLDLVVGNGTGRGGIGGLNLVFQNDGTGTFTDVTAGRLPPLGEDTHAVALGDVDGDGDLDLLAVNHLNSYSPSARDRLYLNDGTGSFTDVSALQLPDDATQTYAVGFGDVDQDGDLDLALGNFGQPRAQNRLYLNGGAGTFTDASLASLPALEDGTASVAFVDTDGDGDLDLLFGNYGLSPAGEQDRLYRNDGAGVFLSPEERLPAEADNTAVVLLGDVDGDGDPDLFVATSDVPTVRRNRLWLNDGTGRFADAPASRMPADLSRTEAAAFGDVDGDGDLDILCGNTTQQSRLYLNNGAGSFVDGTSGRMPTDYGRCQAVALGDVDGDGDLDAVLGFMGSRQDLLYLNDGTGRFVDGTAGRLPASSTSALALVLGDVDGDGDLDLIVGNAYGTQNRLLLNDGTGTFTDATVQRLPTTTRVTTFGFAFGDVDGDGDPDLALATYSQNLLWVNDGTGHFTDATAARMPASQGQSPTVEVVLGDVDGDGDSDLVFASGSQNLLYTNDGTGVFTDATAVWMPTTTGFSSSVALGDVDFDGDMDMVFGNEGQDRLYLNLQRQLDAPRAPQTGQPYVLDAYSRYGPARQLDVVLPFLSPATASIPLPGLGTIGIDPALAVGLPPFVIPQPAGVGTVSITVPNIPALVGGPVYGQAVLSPFPLPPRLSNVTADRIGR